MSFIPRLLFVLMCCAVAEAHAAEPVRIYVATDGNDTWSGRDAKPDGKGAGPFASPARAAKTARALRRTSDVVIEIAAGTYRFAEPLVLTSEDSGVTWVGSNAVFSGGAVISGWREAELNGRKVWTAKGPGSSSGCSGWAISCAGERDFPIEKHLSIHNVPDPKADWEDGWFYFKYKAGAVPTFTVDHAEALTFNRWVESRLPVIRNDEKLHQLRFARRTVFKPGYDDLYRLENAPEFLDEPGEWFLRGSSNEIFYLPMPGEQMEKFAPIVPRLSQLIQMEGKPEAGKFVEHVTFRGITFSHTEWSLPAPRLDETGKPTRGGFVQAAHGVPGVVAANGARHCEFENCTFTHVGSYGLDLGRACQDNKVSRCTFTDLGAGGIKIGDQELHAAEAEQACGNEISDCTIADYGRLFASGCGIFIGQSSGNRLAYNLIHDGYYTGISIGWTWGYEASQAGGNIVEHNDIHHIGKLSNGDGPVLSDMGAVYTLGGQPGTVIRFNRLHDIDMRVYGGWGIYFDEGSSHILAEKNLVYNTATGALHQHYGRENILRNNIFAFGRDRQIERSKSEEHQSFTFERNIVIWNHGPAIEGNWDSYHATFRLNQYAPYGEAQRQFAYQSFEQWQAKGMDEGSVIADPGFVDAEKADFRFKPGAGPAPAIGFEPWGLADVGPRHAN